MNLTLRDFASMRLPLAVFIVVAIVSAVLVRYTSAQHASAESQRRAQETALREARTRFDASGQEREAILRFLPAYRKLEQDGLVGDEKRIEWVESLRNANRQAGLFGVAYQLESRKPFALPGITGPVAQHIRFSEMKLSFGLMHEGDLMRFLEALDAQHSGLFLINRCSIDRPVRADTPPAPRQSNLNAKCELSWLTIAPGKNGS
jgi:hypothetical protein